MNDTTTAELEEYLQLCKDLGYYVEIESDDPSPVILTE